jgi:hypothetical protein
VKKFIFLIILVFVLCSCSATDPELINGFRDPSEPFVQGLYLFEPTIENAINNSTHVAQLSLNDVERFDDNRSLYTFKVDSLLAGDLDSDTIKVLGYNSFYVKEETYLLFLKLVSYTEYPEDIFIPYNPFTFIVNGEDIQCLQQVGDPGSDKARLLVEPFKNQEHNKASFLQEYIASKSKQVLKSTPALDYKDVDYLARESDIIVEITPRKQTPLNPYINTVEFDIITQYKGELALNELTLPNTLEVDSKYIVFLVNTGDAEFSLLARDSILPCGSMEYQEFLSVWGN